MKKSELMITAFLVPMDFLMILLAGFFAYQLRFGEAVQELRPVFYALSLREFLGIIALTSVLFLVAFAFGGLYHVRNIRKISQELSRVILASSTAIMIIIVVIFFQRELFSSRFIIVATWIFIMVFVFLGRQVIRLVNRRLLQQGIGIHRVILFGVSKTTEDLLAYFRAHRSEGYQVVGHFSSFAKEQQSAVADFIQSHVVDEILVTDPGLLNTDFSELLDFANQHHVNFRYVPDLFNVKAANLEVDAVAGIPIIEVKGTPLDGWGRILKRLVDVVGALLLLIILSPVFLVVAGIVLADSGRPILFRSERVGYKNKRFFLLKFRSMIPNAHALKKDLLVYNEREDGPLFKMTNDPRITRRGRFLRRTSLDELPQLWNVLKGEMSLVGPRPHEPEEVALYENTQKRLLLIKPGVTGMAQVSGRSDLKFQEEVRLDLFYIENWSLGLDLQILVKTLWVVLKRQSAV